MAKIPLKTGQRQITTQAPAVKQTQGIFSSEVTRATQELAQVATRISQQFEEAQTLAEKTRADTEAMRKFGELQLEAQETTSIDDIAKFRAEYKNRTNKIHEESSKLITLPQAKSEFHRSFERDAILNDFSIRKTLQHNQNTALEAILNENLTQLRENYISGSPETRQTIEVKRDSLLDDAVKRGVINIEQARETRENQKKEWRLAKLDVDIERDAEFAVEQLLLGKKGIYADVDASDRNTKLATANQRINRNKAIAERNNKDKLNTFELELANKIVNKQATVNDINQAELLGSLGAEGGISGEFATVARRAVESIAAVNPETVADTFVKLQDQFVDLSIKVYTHKKQKEAKITDKDVDIDDIAKFRKDVVEAWGNGEITASNAESWLEAISLVWDKALEKSLKGLGREAAKEVAGDIRSGKIKDLRNFWGRISFWTDEFAVDKAEVKSRLGAELMQRLMGTPQDGNEIVDDLIEKEQKRSNPNRTLYKVDQKINTPSGVWKVVDFDGDGEPILELIK